MEKKFASRAGAKLDFALEKFGISVSGLVCADLGADRGGFTDCLLQRGAKKVYAVEKGYGLLDWKLRNDDRVEVMERQNALHIELPEIADFVVIDVGWTPQKLILPVALGLLKTESEIVFLLKPQYEVDKKNLRKGKVPDEILQGVVEAAIAGVKKMPGVKFLDVVESPIKGKSGKNTEYLMHLQKE